MHFDRVARDQLLSTFREAFADYAMDVSGITAEMKPATRASRRRIPPRGGSVRDDADALDAGLMKFLAG